MGIKMCGNKSELFLIIFVSTNKIFKEINPRDKLLGICCNRWAAAPSVRKPGSFLVALQVQWRNREQQDHRYSWAVAGKFTVYLMQNLL